MHHTGNDDSSNYKPESEHIEKGIKESRGELNELRHLNSALDVLNTQVTPKY